MTLYRLAKKYWMWLLAIVALWYLGYRRSKNLPAVTVSIGTPTLTRVS
jgi:hypothetical protein